MSYKAFIKKSEKMRVYTPAKHKQQVETTSSDKNSANITDYHGRFLYV